jgi:protein-S-isoprenylcysteine O-methyltransferase Ste14
VFLKKESQMLIPPSEPNDDGTRTRKRVWRLLRTAFLLFLVTLGCLSSLGFKSNAPHMDWLKLVGVLSAAIAAVLLVVAAYLYRRHKIDLLVDDDPPVLWGTGRHRGAK